MVSSGGSSTGAYRHSAAYGRTMVNATVMNASTTHAGAICEGVS
jgi:hypothetical protein